MILNLQKKAKEITSNRGDIFSLNDNERANIRHLTSEARLYIDPRQPQLIEGKWHYDLNGNSMKLFQQRWEIMIDIHLYRLLSAKALPIEHSLVMPSHARSIWSNSSITYQFPAPSEDTLSFFMKKG
jgi:hypothetical protein